MAQIDTHRAAYNRPNPNLHCGMKKTNLSPSETEKKEYFYTVSIGEKRKTCHTINQVNELLRISPSAKVVKTTKTTTVRTSHERIK